MTGNPTCAGGFDPGVFQIATTATGGANSACTGITFAVSIFEQGSGKLLFTPDAPVVLPANGATCQVDYTLAVLKMPGLDAIPQAPGVQTLQIADVVASPGGNSAPVAGQGTQIASVSTLAGPCSFDFDGNTVVDALTDGLLLVRALFGLTGTPVTASAVGPGATPTTWAQIRTYMNDNCGTRFSP